MFNARYREDRIEEVRGRPSEVAGKLLAMRKPEMKKLPFTQGEGMINRIADGVAASAIARHFSLWGRYDAMPLTRKQLREVPRRSPLG